MKRIAIISKTYGNGGVEKALVNLLKHIDYNQYQVDLFVPKIVSEVYPEQVSLIKMKSVFSELSIKYIVSHPLQMVVACAVSLLNRINSQRSYITQLRQNVWTQQINNTWYDLAIAYDGPLGYSIFYTLFNVSARKKVFWVHGSIKGDNIPEEIITQYYSNFNKLVFVSESIMNEFVSFWPKMKQKTDFFYNFIDEKEIRMKACQGCEIQKEEDKIVLVTVARLSLEKGIDMAIKVALLLKQCGLRYIWYIVGDGNQRKSLEAEIQKWALGREVIFVGEKDNPYPYMNACDIYIQPSRTEGFCTTTREAKILCKPVVTFDVGGMREQFSDKVNGIIIEREDTKALAQAIFSLAKNPEMRKKMSKELEKDIIADNDEKLNVLLGDLNAE